MSKEGFITGIRKLASNKIAQTGAVIILGAATAAVIGRAVGREVEPEATKYIEYGAVEEEDVCEKLGVLGEYPISSIQLTDRITDQGICPYIDACWRQDTTGAKVYSYSFPVEAVNIVQSANISAPSIRFTPQLDNFRNSIDTSILTFPPKITIYLPENMHQLDPVINNPTL